MNITVSGTGYVGLVSGVCFAEMGHNVVCVDIDENKMDALSRGISPIYEKDLEDLIQKNISIGRLTFTTNFKQAYGNAEVIFVGVGTPENKDGTADLTNIAVVARQIAESIHHDCLVVVKSTVPVGTADKVEQFINDFLINPVKVEVASNPEFLAQGSAVRDTLQADRIIIGAESHWAKEKLLDIYEPFQLPILVVNRRSAEMIKYASNDFLALKISYMNDIANLCELVDADIQDVAKGMGYDKRIGSNFLNAGIGYGGSCFPKDTKALSSLAKQHGYQLKTVNAAIETNEDQRLKLYNKASKRLITFNNLKVAILGVTFKPGTDDLREAPSLLNIPLLLEHGANLYIYDPVGQKNFSSHYAEGNYAKGSITYCASTEEALVDAHVTFIFTEWEDIKKIKCEDYAQFMKTPLVFDGRNIYSPQDMALAGVEYHSIGRAVEMKYKTERVMNPNETKAATTIK
ncbi:UDP-glucose dehydrogenase family protein [Aureibacillus halotolerans]|uniref:UDP-glucose 6-dehydrogenase n=1 Tax=Aureibacillus halotolerans TaxID=1508390 RepID=A0A4R6U3G8_9BACI|nr:UDP-glucose/GDP-mannose dehydrogenase family protein [Aureibacillus halotolerans]TDQ37654.1 UDPglucose 6-dehydrogenase [Aureibacillus halotolerans]